jgi:cell division protein FtsB
MLKILSHPFAIFIISILCLTLWASFYLNSKEIQRSIGSLEKIETQFSQNKEEVAELQKKLEETKKSTSQEAIIRNELLMQKPGEYIVQIPDITPSPEVQSQNKAPQTPWEQWKVVLGIRDSK